MLKMVDGTGIIGVDMICPLGVSTPQPPNYDRVELEGTGVLVLPNSLDAPLERLELGGKTTQMSTRGVNLWSKESKITFTATKQVVFDTPIPAGDYVVSANVTSNDKDGTVCLMLFYYTDSGSKGANLTRTGRSSAKITFTSNVKHVVLYAGSNANGSANDTATFADIQLEKGSTATAYEPYTGGKPSPSPEYPQEIKNSGKWNEEKQKYEVDVQVCNSGYLQKGSYDNKIRAFPLEKGKTYRIYVNINSAVVNTGILDEETTFNHASTLYVYCNKPEYPINNTGIISGKCKIPNNLSRGYTFTVTVDGLFLYQGVNTVSHNTDDAYIAYDFIKTVDMTSPYTEKDPLTLTSDRPITKWDRLVEQGGQIGWLYNSVNETIDGKTGKWSIQPASKIFYRTDITFPIAVPFCSELLGYDYSSVGYKKDTGITINNLGILCITLPEEVELTLDAYKQYLADNPLHVLYKDDSEEFVPLPQSEQNAIRALKAYYPTTVITVDGGELDPDIKVTYRKEI